MSQLDIRRYHPTDRERVEDVMEDALRDTRVYFEDVPEDSAETIEEEYLASGGEFLVGEINGCIVATGALRPIDGLVAEYLDTIPETAVELKRMHVAPSHQRRGYGQQVFHELQRRARKQDHTEFLLNTTSLQTAAQRFYEANGFEEIRREPVQAAGKSFDIVVYRKSLEGQ